jgi:hypothetical protein
MYPAPSAINALWGLPFSDATAAEVVISRMPESLWFPVEIRRFLLEVRRVLEPGGILRVSLRSGHTGRTKAPTSFESAYKDWACFLDKRMRLDSLLASPTGCLDRGSRPSGVDPAISVDALIHLLMDEGFTKISHCDSGRWDDWHSQPRDGQIPSSNIEAHKQRY